MIVDNLDDQLAGRGRYASTSLPTAFFLDLGDEVFDHRQRDVSFEQRHAHFAQGFGYVAFFQRATVGQLAEYRP